MTDFFPVQMFLLEQVLASCKAPRTPWASQMVLVVKNQMPMQETSETRFPSLGQEDPLEEEMTTHSSILAWRIPWAEEPGRL